MTPVALERFRPLVKRTNRLGVSSIKHLPPVAPHVDQADLEQALALGYDWPNDQLSAAEKVQVYTEINRWVSWFDGNGFERLHGFIGVE
jgi:hypothetical protein